MRLRTATLDDLDLLRSWDEQPHVIDADPNDDWGWEVELGRQPDWREQLIVEVDGKPIGFIQIIDPALEQDHYWGAVPDNLRAIDIWIGEPEYLGKGHGTRMMQMALARCFADPRVTAVLIDPLASNTRAHRFYQRLGFRFLERRQFGSDDCFVFQLERSHFRPRSDTEDPVQDAEDRPVSGATAEHYGWGQGCDGWHLLKQPGLSVIEERVPPGAAEVMHHHRRAEQFFYVLAGRATLELDGRSVEIGPRQGCHVAAGVRHQLRNAHDETLEFLVISAPMAHGDRVD